RILLPSQLCGLFPSTNDGTSQFRMRDVDADNLRTLLQTLDPPGTVVWNGPMGVFENARFRAGTSTCLQYLVDATKNHGAVTVAGGGDSEAAIEACLPEAAQVLSHISTGGGAMLAALAGEALPGIDMLDEV
ncbi:MAG: phosphoglycerate kinase, partial [Planctomycetaceae bacterium]|nr:phosphoglycerate kinase [Planctomycetaceae bacterium]